MSHRRERIGHELRYRIAEILERRVRDPRLRSVTVVEVRPSSGANFARVFYRTLGERAQAARALERAKPFIRRCLAEGLELRRVPELDFCYDSAADRGERVEEILRELKTGEDASDEVDPT